MDQHVLMLRAVNVSGRNRIPMAELKTALDTAGFTGVRTYLQTGNIIVDATDEATAAATMVTDLIKATFSVDTTVFVRTGAEFRALIDAYPYPDAQQNQSGVVFVDDVAAVELDADRFMPDTAHRSPSGDVFVHCPTGFGQTRLTVSWIEKTLGCSGTRRNWRTILKIAELMRAD